MGNGLKNLINFRQSPFGSNVSEIWGGKRTVNYGK